MARIHGYDTPEELIRNVDDLAKIYVDPDCHSYFRMLLGEENEVKNFECAAYRKDGRKRWISLTARAVRGSKGTILHYEGTAQDITERETPRRRSCARAKRNSASSSTSRPTPSCFSMGRPTSTAMKRP